MKTEFAKSWKSSKQPRKQRKYRANAPVHIKRKFMAAHLSVELREKYNTRAVILRKGDKVKILRGGKKGTVGKIEKVDVTNEKVSISGIEITKKDGTKKPFFIKPSNILIIELNLEDKLRAKKLNLKTKKEEIKDSKEQKESTVQKQEVSKHDKKSLK